MLLSTPHPSLNIYSRKLLLHIDSGTPAAAPTYMEPNTSGPNAMSIVVALIFAVTVGLVLHAIIRCALRAVKRIWFWPEPSPMERAIQTVVQSKALRPLPTMVYSAGLGLGPECTICLSEFAPGERVRILPKCNHGFHVRCADRWLSAHSSCPTCRECLSGTSQLVFDCDEVGWIGPGPALSEDVLLDLEDFMDDYKGCL